MTERDEPVFTVGAAAETRRCQDRDAYELVRTGHWGLTKRELFAAMAMQGLMPTVTRLSGDVATDLHSVAVASVAMADHLLAALAAADGGEG